MKVAIVHYWLVNMRGGEKVIEALLDLFPNADIFTHIYDPKEISDKIRSHRIYTTNISKFPFAKKLYQKYISFMPNALMKLNLQSYDLIISSESGPAKGIIPNPDAYHICFCHSPMRYIWDMYYEYFENSGIITRFFMDIFISKLRFWDVTSSNLVDRFIANSHYVAKRIKRYYNRDADVVFVPVAIEDYSSIKREPEDFYLFFGQLVTYKRVDIALEACIKSGRKLVVAGAGGSDKEKKKYRNSPLVTFTGKLSDTEVKYYYSRAKALLFPGIEDLGIIPIEANAAGCPVIAYRKGGTLDTIKENVTGIFFNEQNPDSLIDAMEYFEANESLFMQREPFIEHVAQFSKQAFLDRISRIIEEKKRV